MRMKQITANYCVVLLFFVFTYGIYQARVQNRNPFGTNSQVDKSIAEKMAGKNHEYSNIKLQNEPFKSNAE